MVLTKEIALKEEKSSLKALLKETWASVLGIPAMELKDDSHFLKLGGDSLAFVDLYNLIKKALPTNFILNDLIKYDEFGSMHEFIKSRILENGAN